MARVRESHVENTGSDQIELNHETCLFWGTESEPIPFVRRGRHVDKIEIRTNMRYFCISRGDDHRSWHTQFETESACYLRQRNAEVVDQQICGPNERFGASLDGLNVLS